MSFNCTANQQCGSFSAVILSAASASSSHQPFSFFFTFFTVLTLSSPSSSLRASQLFLKHSSSHKSTPPSNTHTICKTDNTMKTTTTITLLLLTLAATLHAAPRLVGTTATKPAKSEPSSDNITLSLTDFGIALWRKCIIQAYTTWRGPAKLSKKLKWAAASNNAQYSCDKLATTIQESTSWDVGFTFFVYGGKVKAGRSTSNGPKIKVAGGNVKVPLNVACEMFASTCVGRPAEEAKDTERDFAAAVIQNTKACMEAGPTKMLEQYKEFRGSDANAEGICPLKP